MRLKVEAKQRQQGRAAGGTTFHLNSANRNGASLKEAESASCTLIALHRSTVTKKSNTTAVHTDTADFSFAPTADWN